MSQGHAKPIGAGPWGLAGGLLAASVVTLIGVARDLDPDVLLLRAAAAGLGSGVVIALGIVVVSWFLHSKE